MIEPTISHVICGAPCAGIRVVYFSALHNEWALLVLIAHPTRNQYSAVWQNGRIKVITANAHAACAAPAICSGVVNLCACQAACEDIPSPASHQYPTVL